MLTYSVNMEHMKNAIDVLDIKCLYLCSKSHNRDGRNLIAKLWQVNLLEGKTAAPSGGCFLNVDANAL